MVGPSKLLKIFLTTLALGALSSYAATSEPPRVVENKIHLKAPDTSVAAGVEVKIEQILGREVEDLEASVISATQRLKEERQRLNLSADTPIVFFLNYPESERDTARVQRLKQLAARLSGDRELNAQIIQTPIKDEEIKAMRARIASELAQHYSSYKAGVAITRSFVSGALTYAMVSMYSGLPAPAALGAAAVLGLFNGVMSYWGDPLRARFSPEGLPEKAVEKVAAKLGSSKDTSQVKSLLNEFLIRTSVYGYYKAAITLCGAASPQGAVAFLSSFLAEAAVSASMGTALNGAISLRLRNEGEERIFAHIRKDPRLSDLVPLVESNPAQALLEAKRRSPTVRRLDVENSLKNEAYGVGLQGASAATQAGLTLVSFSVMLPLAGHAYYKLFSKKHNNCEDRIND